MKKHVLLIDENKEELKSLAAIVNAINESFKCTQASSANEAVEMLRSTTPDFIFARNDLPGINGLQLLSAIKFEPRMKAVKVFIYGEIIGEETIKMARVLGAAGCIEKGSLTDLTHQFKAIFAEELMPSYVMLRGA